MAKSAAKTGAKAQKKAALPAAPAPAVRRRTALEGRAAGQPWVSVTPAAPAQRLSLRAPRDSVAALSKALGLDLPERPMASAGEGGRAALWLGPDEWLVIEEGRDALPAALSGVKAFHSAVDVSHRNLGILVAGRGAEATLASGCPRDLSQAAFPIGSCARTVLGKAEIVVWRTGEEAFRVECWRSFSDYVFIFLAEAARDAGV
ncbi:MAG: sarcosine oxidase subunit gamma [Aquamicrobium sp.]|uniref:sarcosine oxidase subunit gamma n=1 Tax=Aquamicrobium sp. TaxID=1872579 RepID=UPI00349EDDEE|nr:sarcosine oxidase subunit gamma [Aquamicrobium sp.]